MLTYDLIHEGKKIRQQLQEDLNPVVEARNMMSQAILTLVLQALSDGGFYEYLSLNPEFNAGFFNSHCTVELQYAGDRH